MGEVVQGDHGGVEDGGRDVGGDGGKGVESVGRAGAAAAIARDVEELFRRSTACGAVSQTLGRRGQDRGGNGLGVKLWNLGRDVQRVEGEVARACSETKAIRSPLLVTIIALGRFRLRVRECCKQQGGRREGTRPT